MLARRLFLLQEEYGRRAIARGRWAAWAYEFLLFGIKEAWACLFGGALLALLIATHLWYPRDSGLGDVGLARYDFLFAACLALQIAMLAFRLESWEEAKVIFLFHLVGTAMEIFKTAMGSWIYPEASLLRIGGVPLFTGFMYAAVGSYFARIGRVFDMRFSHYPPLWATMLLAAAIYANFYSHHYMMDLRYLLFAATALLYARCWVYFRVWRVHRRMPLLLGFMLVALFIWFAENIGTFTSAWLYPSQMRGWNMVSFAKYGSWFLLMIISFVLVTLVRKPRPIHEDD
ncbi:DUF817 domain-containing protein [Ferrovibrio sp.]|uniref:DUF817 domain-containing protein n=1 Tax=Ferrovibrio sp. TaxID=1917215 RepID=UPI0035B2B523